MKKTEGFYQNNGKPTELWVSSIEFANQYSSKYGFDLNKEAHAKHVAVQLFSEKAVQIATHPKMIERPDGEIIGSLAKNLMFASNARKTNTSVKTK